MRPGELDDGVERRRVCRRQVAQAFAIQLDSGAGQCGNKAIVVDAASPQGRAEAGDPELAEVALLLTAVAVGIAIRAADKLQRLPVLRAGRGDEAAGSL